MAHIDRRNRGGTIRYVARYVDPAGRERSKSFTRRADAQKYLTEVEAAKLKGTWVDPKHGRTRFRDWHAERWPTLFLRPTTRVRDETWYRVHVLPHIGDMPLDAIRQRDVAAWVARLTAHGLAPATVVKVYQLRARRAGGSRVGRLELHVERLAIAQAAGVAAVGSWYHTAQAASKAPIMSSEEASLFSVP
jgi:hypothetical protein